MTQNMTQNIKGSAQITRTAKSGRFEVHQDGANVSTHISGKKTPEIVTRAVAKNRDALQRLANR